MDLVVPSLNGESFPDAVNISSENTVVVVEGAYIWHSLGQWLELRRMLSGLIYVDAGEAFMGAQVRKYTSLH